MIIAVGSKNPTKVRAVERAIYGEQHVRAYDIFLSDVVQGYAVQSSVREQPFGQEETMRGAINRATAGYAAGQLEGACRFSIGIEAGLLEIPFLVHPDSGRRYEEKTYCVIYNEKGYFFGSSAGFEHPQQVVDCVLKYGVDISEAYRRCRLTEAKKIGEEGGCINLLTKGRVTRDQEIADAVRRALIAVENKEMYAT